MKSRPSTRRSTRSAFPTDVGGRGRYFGPLKSHSGALTMVQRLADAAWIVVAARLATHLRSTAWNEYSTFAVVLAVVTFLLIGEVNGLYRSWRGLKVSEEIRNLLTAWLISVPVLLMAGFATKTSDEFSRLATAIWFLLTPLLLGSWRYLVRFALTQLRRAGRNTRRVAVAGATPSAQALIDHIRGETSAGLILHGIYDDREAARRSPVESEGSPFRGDLDLLVHDAHTGLFDVVYISLPLRAEARIATILQRLSDTTTTVYVIADFYGFNLLHSEWATVGNVPVVSIYDTPFTGLGGWMKRLEDLVIGSAILTLIALPMLLIAAAIKLTSPGPVFFRQRRYGLNGREIRVLKFRSMTVCEDGDRVTQAKQGDARITPLGAFLRRTSLDELPQFLQVITGDMSIVGPRPHAVAHNEEYRRLIHGYMLRHKVKPGITGWAQVNGWRGETDAIEKMQQRVEHDLDYIRRWHLGLDLQIILMTIFGSKTRKNAY